MKWVEKTFLKKVVFITLFTTTIKEISESISDGKRSYKNSKEYLDSRYLTNFKYLDDNNIDRIIDKIWISNKNWLKNRRVVICKMRDNSYCLCEDFLKNNETEIRFIFKNRRKRWMIKHGYLKRDSEIRREDREINRKFRQSKWNR